MLWGNNKQIRESLDAILTRINRVDQSLKDFREHARQTHCDHLNGQREIKDKIDKIDGDVAKLLPPNKGKGARKPIP